jgi:hypothetical protein
MPTEEFKQEVDRHLTGQERQETESWEIIYFKVYKSQLLVVEQALSTESLVRARTNRHQPSARRRFASFSTVGA